MTILSRLAFVLALLVFVQTSKARASPDQTERQLGWFSIELDPLTTPLGARNLLLYVEPPSLPSWSFSAVAFAADFPDWVDDILSYRNRDEGFDSKIRLSPGATIDYFFTRERVGWHTGTFVFLWRYQVERGVQETRFTNLIVLPRVGYRWFPTRTGLYLDPFAGLMFEANVAGDTAVDGTQVRPTPIIPFATVHLGFHF